MPWISEEVRNQELQERIDMAGELNVWRNMGHLLGLAGVLRQEIVERIERSDLTPSQIAEDAYQAVLESSLADAHRVFVTEFEEAHRAELFQRVIDSVEATEGETIIQEVRDRVDADPELALQLHESARRELSARALNKVKEEITAEEQVIIDGEAKRQLSLDHLDVEFALEGELDLHRDDIRELLEPGDTLMLTYTGKEEKQGRIVLRWTEDARGQLGWQFVSCSDALSKSDGSTANIAKNRFIGIGTSQHDMIEGEELLIPNLLKRNTTLSMFREDRKGKPKVIDAQHVMRANTYSYSYRAIPLILQSIDFRTKIIEFNEQ